MVFACMAQYDRLLLGNLPAINWVAKPYGQKLFIMAVHTILLHIIS